jgi:hypothetical protein
VYAAVFQGCTSGAKNNQDKQNSNKLSPRHPAIENSEISYKPNIKSTKLVYQQSVCCGLLGRSGPKETQTTKWGCKFKISIRFMLNQYWYIRYSIKENGEYNRHYTSVVKRDIGNT